MNFACKFLTATVALLSFVAHASGQEDEDKQTLLNSVLGEWTIDEKETKKYVLEHHKSLDEKQVEQLLERLAGTRIEYRQDKSTKATHTTRSGLFVVEGTWANPKIDVEKRAVTFTNSTKGSSRQKEVTLFVIEIDGQPRLRLDGKAKGNAVIFKPVIKTEKEHDDR